MTSFFGKLKSGAVPSSPSALSGKKDAASSNMTPLEKMLLTAGPIRSNGSDKFFGMENFGNTCYCNSILQCLYHSIPFREHVLNYPKRSSPESVEAAAATAIARTSALKPAGGTSSAKSGPNLSARNPGIQMGGSQKPDDRDSPEFKKRQALLNGPILNMSYQNTTGYDMPETLFTALKDVFEAIVVNQSRTGVISPTKFLEVLRRDNEMFRTTMHQDAHEFLNWLLNQAVESVEANARKIEMTRRENEAAIEVDSSTDTMKFEFLHSPLHFPPPKTEPTPQPWVHDLFEGTLTSETRCLTCENVSQRDEAFLDLSVDLDQHSSVTACLRRFSEEEMLCERNKFHCDKCGGLQEAEKRMKIKRLPKILALHLKRFKYTEDLQRLQKLFHRVVYPYHLRLFNTTDDAEDPDRLYELYAVVVHIGGGPYHGHYVAIIKTQDRGWLLFDDEMVEPVDQDYVRNFFGDGSALACAYVLFYQEMASEDVRREEGQESNSRASMEDQTTIYANGTADLNQIHTASLPHASDESSLFLKLDQMLSPSHLPPLKAVVTAPSSPIASPVSPRKSDFRWRRDRSKEEKKSTEKEKDNGERQKRKDLESKSKDTQNTEVDHSGAPERSDPAAPEDQSLIDSSPKEASPVLGGLDRFKRTSKSLKFSSLGRKDKPAVLDDHSESPNVADKDKKNRFSIRKKSFGLLS